MTKQKKERVYKEKGKSCVFCKTQERLTIDHIIPKFFGGSDDISNLQVLCRNCNHRKGSRLIFSFWRRIKFLLNLEHHASNLGIRILESKKDQQKEIRNLKEQIKTLKRKLGTELNNNRNDIKSIVGNQLKEKFDKRDKEREQRDEAIRYLYEKLIVPKIEKKSSNVNVIEDEYTIWDEEDDYYETDDVWFDDN